MRKTVFFFLALCLILNAEERWIGSLREEIQCPNPIPFQSPLPHGEFNPALDTLKYDDGTAANAWAYTREGNGWGVRFVPPISNGTITGALIHLWPNTWPVPGGNRFMVRVYDSDGQGGSPGTLLYSSDTLTGTRGAWNLHTMNVPFTNGPFYIFYVQPDTYPSCPGLSIDRNENAPMNSQWQMLSNVFSSDDARGGEWLIRSIIDWTPQDSNIGTTVFGNLILDTIPGVSLQFRATVKNFGNQTLAAGVPVRLMILGPGGYTYLDNDQGTTVSLARGQTQALTFAPNWRTPDTLGVYTVKAWTELSGDAYPANDTITREFSVGRWITYANWASTWIRGQLSPYEKATNFDPTYFRINYPVIISGLRSQFYIFPGYPWDDSLFKFKIYGNDGQTLLYESDTIRAAPYPAVMTHIVIDTVVITSGNFYVSIEPRTNYPTLISDTLPRNRSYYGWPGSWAPYDGGEWFISASVKTGVGIEETRQVVKKTKLSITNYPNPFNSGRIEWQLKEKSPIRLTLYDATGRFVRTVYESKTPLENGVIYFDTKGLTSGVYLLRLKSPKERATAKLIIQS